MPIQELGTMFDETCRQYSRAELETRAEKLASFIKDNKEEVSKSYEDGICTRVHEDVLAHVETFLSSPTSMFLWVEAAAPKSNTSPAAFGITQVLAEAGIPCVSFFPKRRYQRGFIALLYSLITQLIPMMPAEFDSDFAFEEAGFAKLDGTLASAELALGMIDELLVIAPTTMVFVIDRIDLCEMSETRKYVRQLVQILRHHGSKVKGLFTTTGDSRLMLSVCGKALESPGMTRVLSGRLRGFVEVSSLNLAVLNVPK